MLIQGSLAEYNPTEGHSVYVLYDAETNEISTFHQLMYLAFTGVQSHQVAPEQQDKWATLILQVDLTRVTLLTCFATYGMRRGVKTGFSSALRRRKVYHTQDWVWLILFAIGCGFTSPSGELFVAGTFEYAKNKLLPASAISDASDGIISIADEYEGLPRDGKWVRLPECQVTPVLGGNIYQSVAQMLNISPDVVQQVLSAVATVVIDTGVKAMRVGANAVDFYIPPLGVMEVRDNPYNRSELSIGFAPLPALGHMANSIYGGGLWRPVDLMERLMHFRSHGEYGHVSTAWQKKMYNSEKKLGRKPRQMHRELRSINEGGDYLGVEEDD